MAFDGFVTHKIAEELQNSLAFGKIDKIYQPEKDEICISVRTREGLFRMVISAATANPRLHLTEITHENPLTAPLFCMILRKHLVGGKIKSISQIGFDRVVSIEIECYTELGDLTVKRLIVEIMGRHSNIILVRDDNKIIDSIKHIDFTTSSVRQVLPGLFYELPPAQDKVNPCLFDKAVFYKKLCALASDALLDKFLLSEFTGMSPLMSREIIYRFSGNTRVFAADINPKDFADHTSRFIADFLNSPTHGCVVSESASAKSIAFSAIELLQYSDIGKTKTFDSLSNAVETFFASRDMQDRLAQKSAGTLKVINNNLERCEKKIALHTQNIKTAKNRDKYKIFGDLITANLYQIQPNNERVTVTNYYSDTMEEIEIPLKPELSPSKNAQRYYKLFAKAKATEEHSSEQLKNAVLEKEYLESVLDSLNRATQYGDIAEIREELAEQGYISVGTKKKKKSLKKSSPMKFLSSDGYVILVGRNNKQNDELTIKNAYSTDIWLHTKNLPGSHTIIRTNGTGEVPDKTLVEAATIAAYFSKGQNSSGIPVDYTLVKNIRKPNGSKPGFVIYETNYTVYVTPDEKLVQSLKCEQ